MLMTGSRACRSAYDTLVRALPVSGIGSFNPYDDEPAYERNRAELEVLNAETAVSSQGSLARVHSRGIHVGAEAWRCASAARRSLLSLRSTSSTLFALSTGLASTLEMLDYSQLEPCFIDANIPA